MLAQGQPNMAIILDHFPARRHRTQSDHRLVLLGHDINFATRGGREERQWLVP